MASRKVYVHFGEAFTTKIVVEENSPCSDILVKFINAYDAHQQANGGPILDYHGVFLNNENGKHLQLNAKAMKAAADGEDLYVVQDAEAAKREKQCSNAGCGQTFTDETNRPDVCYHHPGKPVFHEGRKGWACCSKRVDDFEEALRLPGCTLGPHRSEMPAVKGQAMLNKPVDPKYLPKTSVNGVETFALGGAASPAPNARNAAVTPPPPVQIIEEPDDPLDAVIAVGTKCRHNGCHHGIFKNDESRTEPCVYHPGLPVFHEGSKYWTCCKPRCAEFEEFLKIEGCKVGRHKFVPKPGDVLADPNAIKCRYDFYQQGDLVIVSVYGKNMDKAATTFTFLSQALEIKVRFKDGKKFDLTVPLYGQIDPAQCSYEVLSTKAEIKLFKATPIVWTSLEPEENATPQ